MSYSVSVQDSLSNLYYGGSANVPWEQALDGLSAEQAQQRPAGLPHSVADLVAHVQFWQHYLLSVFRGEDPEWVEHADQGWPGMEEVHGADGWEVLKIRFFRDMDSLANYAQDEAFMHQQDPTGRFRIVPLTNFAGHSLYHLGQVVTVRQLIGAWPPPAGGDTW
jgi:uncharacterized damage-inducible protein DinB